MVRIFKIIVISLATLFMSTVILGVIAMLCFVLYHFFQGLFK
jgi:hypothetical protein